MFRDWISQEFSNWFGGFIIDYYFYFLSIHFLLILIFFFFNLEDIKRYFGGINKRSWILLFGVLIFASYLRLTMSPLDDWIPGSWEYKFGAKNFLLEQKAYGLQHPRGFSFIMLVFYLIIGLPFDISLYKISLVTSYFFSLLTVFSVFLFSYILFKNEKLSLFSSLITALLPWSVRLSTTGDPKVASPSVIILSLTLIVLSFRINKQRMYFLTFLFLFFSAEVRMENIVLLSFFPWCYILFGRHIGFGELIKKSTIPFMISCILSIPLAKFLVIPYFTTGYFKGAEDLTFSIKFLKRGFPNFIKNFSTFFPGILWPFIAYFFIVFNRYRKGAILLLTWLAVFFIIVTAYYNNNGTNVWYYTVIYSAFAMVFGAGLSIFIRWLYLLVKNNSVGKVLEIFTLLVIILSIYPIDDLMHPSPRDFYGRFGSIDNLMLASEVIEDKDAWVMLSDGEEMATMMFLTSFKIGHIQDLNLVKRALNEGEVYFVDTRLCTIQQYNRCDQIFNMPLNFKKIIEIKGGEAVIYEIRLK